MNDNPESGKDVTRNTRTDDELYEQVRTLVLNKQQASIPLIQEAFHVGWGRASRLMDLLETEYVIGPSDGTSAPRRVLSGDEAKAAKATRESRYSENSVPLGRFGADYLIDAINKITADGFTPATQSNWQDLHTLARIASSGCLMTTPIRNEYFNILFHTALFGYLVDREKVTDHTGYRAIPALICEHFGHKEYAESTHPFSFVLYTTLANSVDRMDQYR